MAAKAAPKSETQEWLESGRDRVVPRDPPEAPPDWLAHAIRFCRDGEDGLARILRPVPAEYLRPENGVRCACAKLMQVPDREFVECPGDCGRWFVRDGETVWAARLPRDDS